MFGDSFEQDLNRGKKERKETLSETDRKLRDQFYTEPASTEGLSDIERMIQPRIKAPQLYKELVRYGHKDGWIEKPEEYPLMYPLLYNAEDTALAVEWRFHDRTGGDSLFLSLSWCVFTAMADVYYCDRDWEDLRTKGLLMKLESVCGIDYIDELVVKLFHIRNVDELQEHVKSIASLAMTPYTEVDSTAKPLQKTECLTAAYYYGIKLGMQYSENKGIYSSKRQGDRYTIYEGDHVLLTPGGKEVTTLYKDLADRIVYDLNHYGMNYTSSDSILSWHYTTIENFAPMGHDRAEQVMVDSFLQKPDWTCLKHHEKKWDDTFGDWRERRDRIAAWLKKCTVMQMVAACCIGNAYHTLNLAFVFARIMEKCSGEERFSAVAEVAKLFQEYSMWGTYNDIIKDFGTFELYYGIHLEENGPILEEIPADSTSEEMRDNLDVNNLKAYSVTEQQLVGRNYYHYTDGQKDAVQPYSYSFPDLQLDEADEDPEDDDPDDETDDNILGEYLPEQCWVKRFVDDEDATVFYLLYLVTDEDGSIVDSGCIVETLQRRAVFFMIPGMETPCEKYYEFTSNPPEKVLDDLKKLFNGRSLPLDFSFVGKEMGQSFFLWDWPCHTIGC